MSIMNDVRKIIQPIPQNYYTYFSKNLDSILENYIMHNNMIFNSYNFNHIIYTDKSMFENIDIIGIVNKYILQNIRQKRLQFRDMNKKNKLTLSNINSYFNSINELLSKLTSLFQHIDPIIYDSKKKWGSNSIISYTIKTLCNLLCHDEIIKSVILKNIIYSHDIKEKYNNEMDKYVRNMTYYSTYVDESDKFFNVFGEMFDKLLNNTMPTVDVDFMDSNIVLVNTFNKVYNYYIDSYYKYNYITNKYKLVECCNRIFNILQDIITRTNVIFIKHFIITYKKEIKALIKHIDISVVFLTRVPTDINSFIIYYSTLLDISNDNSEYEMIIKSCIELDVNKHFNNTASISIVANLVNKNIINKEPLNCLPYIIGFNMNNKDEFISYISVKLTERILYTKVDIKNEQLHYEYLSKIFNNKKLLYKYHTILNDYYSSKLFANNLNFTYYNQIYITSLNSWEINYKSGYTDSIINSNEFTTNLCNILYKYNSANVSKKLNIYAHIGYVDITIINTNLIVLPAHMFILELFDKSDIVLSYDYIFNIVKTNMNNYSDDFIKKIIQSLINGNVIKKIDNNITLAITEKSPKNINMIEITKYLTNYSEYIEKEISINLAHDRIDIISANINHYVKQKKYKLDELFILIKNNIKVFTLTQELFDKTIDRMSKNNYIIFDLIENDTIIKLEY
jgi:hypothetical protein